MKRTLTRILAVLAVLVLAVATLIEAQTTGTNDFEIQRFTFPGGNTTAVRMHASLTVPSHATLTIVGKVQASGGYKTPYTFAHPSRIMPGLSNSAIPIVGSAVPGVAGTSTSGVSFQTVPTDGSIVGLAIGAASALTTGNATCEATIFRDGATVATGRALSIGAGFTQSRFNATTIPENSVTFVAGEGVGVRLTTSASLAPSDNQLVCTLITKQ